VKRPRHSFPTRARLIAIALVILVVGYSPVALAQGGPSVAPAFSNEILSTLDLPGIELTQAENGTVEGLPTELVSGTYLVTIASDGDFASYINFVQPPAGLSTEEATAQMLETAAMDVPHEGWVYGGGSYAVRGNSPSFGINLEPGQWQIAISRFVEEQGEEIMQLFPLTVTGDATSATPTYSGIPSHQILELRDVEFDGLLYPVQAGPSIWQVVNTGTQPRQVVFWLAPYQITAEQFQEVMEGLMSGAPSDSPAFNISDLAWVGYASILSPGQQVWLEMTLPAADYLAVSYVIDPATQQPAFALGMVEPFTVVDESDEEEVISGQGSVARNEKLSTDH
jgi:hypothetical protein